MKNFKIIYLLLIASVMMWSCDPLEDEIDEIKQSDEIVKALNYTLTDDDYDFLDKNYDVAGFGNFDNIDDAREFIPFVLNDKYPQLGEGSSVVVSYDFYNGGSPYLKDGTSVTVTDAEYEALDYGFGNFDNLQEDLPIYAAFKVANPSNNDYLDVTHDFYSGGTGFVPDSVSRVVYTAAYGWMLAQPLPEAVYGDFFSESGIDFSFSDEGAEKIPVYLNETIIFKEVGDRILVQYNFDNGEDENPTEQDLALYTYDGSNWVIYGDSGQITTESLKFAVKDGQWVPDNTVRLTFVKDDYIAVGNAYNDINPDGAGSASNYSNFDVGLWTADQIQEAVIGRITEKYGYEEGQKYVVTYALWLPGDGSETLSLIGSGGEYIINTEE